MAVRSSFQYENEENTQTQHSQNHSVMSKTGFCALRAGYKVIEGLFSFLNVSFLLLSAFHNGEACAFTFMHMHVCMNCIHQKPKHRFEIGVWLSHNLEVKLAAIIPLWTYTELRHFFLFSKNAT